MKFIDSFGFLGVAEVLAAVGLTLPGIAYSALVDSLCRGLFSDDRRHDSSHQPR